MNSVISLHIGEAGIQTGSAVWDIFLQEHTLFKDGRSHFDSGKDSYTSFFDENQSGVLVPRCLIIDTDPFLIHKLQSTGLYSSSSFIKSKSDTGGIFSRGFYEQQQLLDETEDRIRKTMEDCGNHQFLVYHSAGGGTGSGFTSLLLESLDDRKRITNVTIFPSIVSASPIEFYNTLLSSSELIEYSNGVLFLDNTALLDNSQINYGSIEPSANLLNQPIQQILSSMTYSMRFSNDTNLLGIETPIPQMLFHWGSCYPFGLLHASTNSNTVPHIEDCSTNEITERLFHPHYSTTKMDSKRGRYASACVMFRGDDLQPTECRESITLLHKHQVLHFVDWSPAGFKNHLQKKFKNSHSLPSATLIANSTEIKNVFAKYLKKFDMLYSKKSFFHWYQQAGSTETDFEEAIEAVRDAMLCYDELDYAYV